MSSKLCLETLPCNILRAPPAGHCLDTLAVLEVFSLLSETEQNGQKFLELVPEVSCSLAERPSACQASQLQLR